MDKAQREYFLRQQLETIKKELGEESGAQVQELSEAIAGAKMPPEVEKEARKELARLERMPQAAAEYSMLRTYLDLLVELPWSKSTQDNLDLARAERILDEDHHGLKEVKRRIIEFLAVRKLNPSGKSPILCLVGPPGTGKTSLGQSIARALERKFERISLGGVHDEAEIRGHRRTYIGALPGNIVQALRKAESNNPVLMLDELDKLGQGIHGDPASALLEVLDPEQNSTFRDNYLGVPFDLRRVFFIGTANVLDRIPGPLRDRCEVIEMRGYTEEEKLQIARRYQLKRQLEATGLEPEQCEITEGAIRAIIHGYTREAGCRNLERTLGSVCRHVATRIAKGEIESKTVREEDLLEILGPPKYESEVALRTSVPGVATGMAWTPSGGEILFIEATRMPGGGKLILTGQLGDVMKESARAALSVVKNRCAELEIDPEVFARNDIHVHIPAGAIPKDGPSAGVTIYIALASLLTERTVRSDVAMTGEISLRGLVLPIGGVREKVLAALAAGIGTVLLPARNQKDLVDIPDDAREKLEIVWLETVDDAVDASLEARALRSA
jgi:ATP-dependent Lon protease